MRVSHTPQHEEPATIFLPLAQQKSPLKALRGYGHAELVRGTVPEVWISPFDHFGQSSHCLGAFPSVCQDLKFVVSQAGRRSSWLKQLSIENCPNNLLSLLLFVFPAQTHQWYRSACQFSQLLTFLERRVPFSVRSGQVAPSSLRHETCDCSAAPSFVSASRCTEAPASLRGLFWKGVPGNTGH